MYCVVSWTCRSLAPAGCNACQTGSLYLGVPGCSCRAPGSMGSRARHKHRVGRVTRTCSPPNKRPWPVWPSEERPCFPRPAAFQDPQSSPALQHPSAGAQQRNRGPRQACPLSSSPPVVLHPLHLPTKSLPGSAALFPSNFYHNTHSPSHTNLCASSRRPHCVFPRSRTVGKLGS